MIIDRTDANVYVILFHKLVTLVRFAELPNLRSSFGFQFAYICFVGPLDVFPWKLFGFVHFLLRSFLFMLVDLLLPSPLLLLLLLRLPPPPLLPL